MSHRPNFAVFEKIDTEWIESIFETADGHVICNQSSRQTLDKITSHTLTEKDIDAINDVYVTFVKTENPIELAVEIDSVSISKDRQDALKRCLTSLKEKLSEKTTVEISKIHSPTVGNSQVLTNVPTYALEDLVASCGLPPGCTGKIKTAVHDASTYISGKKIKHRIQYELFVDSEFPDWKMIKITFKINVNYIRIRDEFKESVYKTISSRLPDHILENILVKFDTS